MSTRTYKPRRIENKIVVLQHSDGSESRHEFTTPAEAYAFAMTSGCSYYITTA